jgi:hypothetical protein
MKLFVTSFDVTKCYNVRLLKIWGSLKFIGQLKVNGAAQKNGAAEKCWVVSLAHFRNSRVGPPKVNDSTQS